MAENIIYPIVLISIGALNLFYGLKFLSDPKFTQKYIETSPKAWIWRKMFGVEKAIQLTKAIFAPFGITFGISCFGVGIYLFTI